MSRFGKHRSSYVFIILCVLDPFSPCFSPASTVKRAIDLDGKIGNVADRMHAVLLFTMMMS